ncbi:MAG: tRNA dimethylallyltransferase [Bacteroidales bacterium]|nr:tRNA dimethylallyltransferase [Bacteroidales bacterium]
MVHIQAAVPPAPIPEPEKIDPAEVAGLWRRGEIDLVVVLGPTASGKTRFAVSLAKALASLPAAPPAAVTPRGAFQGVDAPRNVTAYGLAMQPGTAAGEGVTAASTPCKAAGAPSPAAGVAAEIVSADSRQVYRGMTIGTGKDLGEYGDVPYHMIDIVPAGEKYTLYDYQRDFEKVYAELRGRGVLPILCGGTGLYIDAVVRAYSLPAVPPDEQLRRELEAADIEELREAYAERTEPDPEVMVSKRRLVRALEVLLQENVEKTSYKPKRAYFIGTVVSREERNERIDRRLDERLAGGMIDEVRGLVESGVSYDDLIYYGLEYRYIAQYLMGLIDYESMRGQLATAIHQFAKRQMTYFRGMESHGTQIHWTRPEL